MSHGSFTQWHAIWLHSYMQLLASKIILRCRARKFNMLIENTQYASVQPTKTDPEITVEHNLAVVVGAPSNRKRQEVALFEECSHFRTRLVFSSMEKPWIIDGADYAYTELVKLLPDFISGVAVRK